MFRERVLTALLLLLGLGVAGWLLPPGGFVLLLLVVVALAADEWASLNALGGARKGAYIAAVLALSVGLLPLPLLPVLGFGLVLWLWLLVELFAARRGLERGLFANTRRRLIVGALILGAAWRSLTLVALMPHGRGALLVLLGLVAGADMAAYFVGRSWGRHRLAPHVSPGKTLEGVVGGMLGAAAVAYGVGVGILRVDDGFAWIGVACVLALSSVVGDLTESRAKRIAGVKDSGSWLPGHGGILDRIDGYTAAAPVFALASLWLARP